MNAPSWFLTIVYWIHITATVVWVGGLTSLSFLLIPAFKKVLSIQQQADLLNEFQRRFRPISWLALILLSGTGMIQMGSHPKYDGFLAIDNQWAIAIFIKHGLILLLIASMGLINWGILPAMQKLALKQSVGKTINMDEKNRLEKQERVLIQINLVLSLLVLILTAWARAVS
jgi:uncharacterized membrane protein